MASPTKEFQMSELKADAQVVAKYYSAFNRKDWGSMLCLVADDVMHDMNQGERAQGKAAFQKFLAHMEGCYDEILEDLVITSNGQGRVAAEFMVRGKYLKQDGSLPPARGQSYLLPAGAFLVVNSKGLISRVTTYYNLKAWLKMVS
jgi:steroid delta-isomerase-like uncharacterized protein